MNFYNIGDGTDYVGTKKDKFGIYHIIFIHNGFNGSK